MITPDLIRTALANSDLDQFHFKEGIIAGDECVLVVPKEMGVDWNEHNAILRSCLYRKCDYLPLNILHKKFWNYGEKPSLYPDPNSFPPSDWTIDDKLDGSLIGVSRYKGQLVVRTRGTFNALDDTVFPATAPELRNLLSDNPRITDNGWVMGESDTFLFEHITPTNQIVIRYDKPELVLLGIISHYDYSYWPTCAVDTIAASIGIRRPDTYHFTSLSDIAATASALKGKEGYVLSYNNNQNRVKLKADEYLRLHRLKSSLSSFSNVLDLYFERGLPADGELYKYIEGAFDHELAKMTLENVVAIESLRKDADKRIADISMFLLANNMTLRPKKEAAQMIIAEYGASKLPLQSLAFNLLNGKGVDDKMMRRLMEALRENG